MSAHDQHDNEPEGMAGDGREVIDPSGGVWAIPDEIIPLAVLIVDQKGKILRANGRARELFGRAGASVIGGRLQDFMKSAHRAAFDEFLANLGQESPLGALETQLSSPGSAVVDVLIHGRTWARGSHEVVVVSVNDVTRWRHVGPHSQLNPEHNRRRQRMEVIGRLTSCIAHDFNNLLSVINGYNRVLLNEVDNPDYAHYLNKIADASRRAASLVDHVLMYGRGDVPDADIIDLNEHIVQFQDLFVQIVGKNVRWLLELAPQGCQIELNSHQLDQILMNLVLNARDAMNAMGELRLTTRMENISAEQAEDYNLLNAGSHVVLEVSDTGCGMDAESARRAFEPFFSTKTAEEGTGLGLATVRSIARDCGGDIFLESAPGEGTCFRIYFPAPNSQS